MQSPHSQPARDSEGLDHRHASTAERLRRRFDYSRLRDPAQGSTALARKNHFVAAVGEFVGTFLFLFFAFGGTNVALLPSTSVTGGTQEGQGGLPAATANTSNLLYISLIFGFSLALNVWIFFRVSGGLLNPAGAITPLRFAIVLVAELLAGICAAAVLSALLPGPSTAVRL
ncbi:uncharacterized protein JCM6883_000816 [Sporobolomyces salmoneus]|uniref:uncharacterized protein n=1 Tax=Sporobolomyces salmoneus TaxID=183962 RepID=UPI00317A6FB1